MLDLARERALEFTTKEGKEVSFKAKKEVPKKVRVSFLTRPKKTAKE